MLKIIVSIFIARIEIDEFSAGNLSSDDDEETIAKEEAEQASDARAEIAALKKESEMDLDEMDFLADYLRNRDNIILSENDDDDMIMDKSSSSRRTVDNVSRARQSYRFMYVVCDKIMIS